MTESGSDLRFERFELPSGIRLSILPTRKLKTVLIKAFFPGDLDDRVTRTALVPMVLRRGTRGFPSLQAINRRLEDLYGASLVTGVSKAGEWHVIKFRLEAVNGRFLPGREDVSGEAIRFLREMVFEPALENGAFRGADVEQEKRNLQLAIESLLDNKFHYAMERLIREMCAGEPFRRYELGDAADLPAIDAAGLARHWDSCVRGRRLEIYAAGDFDAAQTRDLLAGVFSAPRAAAAHLAPPPAPIEAGEPRSIEERMAINQGKLCLGFRQGITYSSGDLEAAVVANGILGAFPHSKLFRNVREKASLAYDVHSSLEKIKGLLFIGAGIAVENHQQALDIILRQVKDLERGDISDEEMNSTIESFDNHLQMLEDGFSELMEVDFIWNLHGRAFDIGEYRRRLRAVTRERVAEAARRLRLDTVYFLRS